MEKKKQDWFKLKKYPHIDRQISANERMLWIEKYITNPEKIKTHSFLPLIHKTQLVRKFRKEYNEKDGNVTNSLVAGKLKPLRKAGDPKKRELYYASHIDSLVYSYFAQLLAESYEKQLEIYKLKDVVTAYRSIPVSPNSNKCNIDFAVDVFNLIKQMPCQKFAVVAFDIKGFFDNLNHSELKKRWIEILGVTQLADDHYNVFKSITRFTYVDLVDIFKTYQDKILLSRTEYGKEIIKQARVSKIKYLKKQKAVAFCTKEEFLKNSLTLIKRDKWTKDDKGNVTLKDFGIPQGSPISAVLANIYMIGFDKIINDSVSEFGGVYRRYSDDMVVICPFDKIDDVVLLFDKKIDSVLLEIQHKKTQRFVFERAGSKLSCGQIFESEINWNKNFQYLGFEFDGKKVKIKSAGLSGYYRKMKRSIKRAKYFSRKINSKHPLEIFKARIFRRFSHVGAERRRKYKWNNSKKHFEVTHHYDWGNYISYAQKAKKMKIANSIESQIKKHWVKLNLELKKTL